MVTRSVCAGLANAKVILALIVGCRGVRIAGKRESLLWWLSGEAGHSSMRTSKEGQCAAARLRCLFPLRGFGLAPDRVVGVRGVMPVGPPRMEMLCRSQPLRAPPQRGWAGVCSRPPPERPSSPPQLPCGWGSVADRFCGARGLGSFPVGTLLVRFSSAVRPSGCARPPLRRG